MWLESADRTAMVGWLRLAWVLVATKRVCDLCLWVDDSSQREPLCLVDGDNPSL